MLTFFLVIVGFAGNYIAFRASNAATSAARTGRDTLVLDQRAWVTVTRFKLPFEIEAGKPIWVEYSVRNTGKTTAVGETIMGDLHMWQREQPMDPFPEPKERQVNIIPPGTLDISAKTDPPRVFSALDVGMYKTRSARLYIHGRCSYEDIFGVKHWTTFCAFHDHGQALNTFSFCDGGNEIDRNR